VALTAIKTYFTKMVSVQFSGSTENMGKGALWAFKESLLYGSGGVKGGPGSWTVVGSCDGSTYGVDGVDRWIDWTKLAGKPWVILRQPAMGLAPGFYQLLIYKPSSSYYADFGVSFSVGFSGGNLTTRPTASDEKVRASIFHTSSNQYSPYTVGVNCVKSTDGEVTRVFFSQAGLALPDLWNPLNFIFMEKAKNPQSWWTNPCMFIVGDPGSEKIWQWFAVGSDFSTVEPINTIVGTTQVPARFTSEGTGISGLGPSSFYYPWIINKAVFQRPDFNGEWVLSPPGIISASTVVRGRLGEFYDLWLAPQTMPLGEYIASTGGGERRFINLYNTVVPWDGTHLMLP